jgi:hypothetical protein
MDGAEDAEVVAFPATGEVLVDERGESRFMRVAWHCEAGVVVLSLWQHDRCTGTFRLPIGQVPRLVQTLVDGLAGAAGAPPGGATLPLRAYNL